MKEIDARFVATSPSVFDQILEYGKFGGYDLALQERQLLVTDYFDTERWDLLKSTSVVDLCRLGRVCTLSFKSYKKENGRLQTIEEYSDVLEDGYPEEVGSLDIEVVNQARKITQGRPLFVVLTVENNRSIIEMSRYGKKRFQMVLDDVEFVGARDQRRHFEVEVQADGGDEYELEALLGILKSGFPLEPSTESKFERGLRLLRAWPVGITW